ncbi:MAG: O-antigen polymerase [Candidatus Uhrbacteria bacterium]
MQVFVCVVVLCIALSPALSAAVRRRDLFSPINIFGALYGVSFGLVPLLQLSGWVSLDHAYAHYDTAFGLRASILSIVALLVTLLGYYEGHVARMFAEKLPSLRNRMRSGRMRIIMIGLILISAAALAVRMSQIDVQHISEYFIYTNVSASGYGHIAFFVTLYLFAGLVASVGMFRATKGRRRLFVVVFLLALVLAALSRARGQVLLLLFVVMVIYNYRVRRIGAVRMVSAFVGMLIFAFAMGQFRGAQDFQMTKMNIANSFGGLFAEHQATAVLLSQYSRENPAYLYGKIFVEDTAFSLIPRKIWTTKPIYYGGIVVTDTLIPNRQPGYHYTEGPFGAAFADLGYIGVFIAMLMIGWLMRVAYEYLRKNIHHDGVLLWYALFCFDLWAFLRGGFGFIPVIMMHTILVVVLYTFIARTFVVQSKMALH